MVVLWLLLEAVADSMRSTQVSKLFESRMLRELRVVGHSFSGSSLCPVGSIVVLHRCNGFDVRHVSGQRDLLGVSFVPSPRLGRCNSGRQGSFTITFYCGSSGNRHFCYSSTRNYCGASWGANSAYGV